jgi:NAD(P)-dependent dehydrogenase (short-subunit alcohol dehydrogenase family)
MINEKQGIIVNFTSRWGTMFEKQMAPYCATKWAVVALTRVLAEELRLEGIAAVGLNPGIINTGMLQKYLGDNGVFEVSKYPTAADWASAAVPYILSLGLKDSGKLRTVSISSKAALRHIQVSKLRAEHKLGERADIH